MRVIIGEPSQFNWRSGELAIWRVESIPTRQKTTTSRCGREEAEALVSPLMSRVAPATHQPVLTTPAFVRPAHVRESVGWVWVSISKPADQREGVRCLRFSNGHLERGAHFVRTQPPLADGANPVGQPGRVQGNSRRKICSSRMSSRSFGRVAICLVRIRSSTVGTHTVTFSASAID